MLAQCYLDCRIGALESQLNRVCPQGHLFANTARGKWNIRPHMRTQWCSVKQDKLTLYEKSIWVHGIKCAVVRRSPIAVLQTVSKKLALYYYSDVSCSALPY